MDEDRLDDTSNVPTEGGEKPADAHQPRMDPVEDESAGDDASSSDDEEREDIYFDLYDDADIITVPDDDANSMPLLAADFHERGVSFPDAFQRFNRIFRARYPAMPKELEFYPGELVDAVQEAFRNAGDGMLNDGSHLPAAERRLLVLYLHTDHRASIARNLFAERVFRNDLIVELLTERCVLWGWDVTAERNKALLQEQMEAAEVAGLSKQVWKYVKGVLPHLYPLLIVVKGKGCSPTILANGSSDYAEAATRLCCVIEGRQPLTTTELQAQLDSDAEMARRIDEEQRRMGRYVPTYYPQFELTTDRWATSPPYPADSTIPLWRDEKGCVDDRRLVKPGVEAVPAPAPAIDFDLNEEPAVVKFAQVNVIAPRQVAYDHLTFHAKHMTFSGLKTRYGIAIPYSEVKRLFFVRGDELRIAYFMIQWNNRGDEDFVVIKLYHVQDPAKLEVDVSGIGAASLPRDFVDAVNEGSLSAGEGPIFERMGDVLQLLCRKPLIVSHGFAAENAKPLIFCSIPASTGFLYPLDEGLAFISIVPHFIPYEQRVELRETQQRPGRKDIVVTKKDGTQLTFSHVNQLDMDLLKAYLQAVNAEVVEVPEQAVEVVELEA